MTLKELLSKEWHSGGLKPGTVIKLANGKSLLVGDINPLGGVCDDCTHEDEDIEIDENPVIDLEPLEI